MLDESTVRLPVSPRAGRFLVLVGVFVCAACGLVYELELVAVAAYLIGDSVTQASVVLSVMVFAMGIGSLLAKRLRRRAPLWFGLIEAALALVGGCSAMALYAAFAWTGDLGGAPVGGPRHLLAVFSLAIGILIGAEVPLLVVLIQRIRRQDAGGAVADVFAADYVGALVGGLAFPFLLLPVFGQLTGALFTGAVNAVAGCALVLGLFWRGLSVRGRWAVLAANVLVLAVLASAAVLVGDFERAARRAVYGADARVAVRTDVQEIVLTGGRKRSFYLFLDGRLRISGVDERRYHRALVDPAMRGAHARVLILGGGDGLAAREVLRHRGVRRVRDRRAGPGRRPPGAPRPGPERTERPRLPRPPAAGGARRGVPSAALPARDVRRGDLRPAGPGHHPRHEAVLPGVLRPRHARARPRWPPRRARGARLGPAADFLDGGGVGARGGAADRALPRGRAAVRVRRRARPHVGGGARGPRLGLRPGRAGAAALREATGSAPVRAGVRSAAPTRVAGLPASTLVHPRYAN